MGRAKGSSFVVWFLISAAVPILGLLAAIFYRSENHELRRRCPGCGRIIMLYDAVCTNCGHELEFPDRAIASRAQVRSRASGRPA